MIKGALLSLSNKYHNSLSKGKAFFGLKKTESKEVQNHMSTLSPPPEATNTPKQRGKVKALSDTKPHINSLSAHHNEGDLTEETRLPNTPASTSSKTEAFKLDAIPFIDSEEEGDEGFSETSTDLSTLNDSFSADSVSLYSASSISTIDASIPSGLASAHSSSRDSGLGSSEENLSVSDELSSEAIASIDLGSSTSSMSTSEAEKAGHETGKQGDSPNTEKSIDDTIKILKETSPWKKLQATLCLNKETEKLSSLPPHDTPSIDFDKLIKNLENNEYNSTNSLSLLAHFIGYHYQKHQSLDDEKMEYFVNQLVEKYVALQADSAIKSSEYIIESTCKKKNKNKTPKNVIRCFETAETIAVLTERKNEITRSEGANSIANNYQLDIPLNKFGWEKFHLKEVPKRIDTKTIDHLKHNLEKLSPLSQNNQDNKNPLSLIRNVARQMTEKSRIKSFPEEIALCTRKSLEKYIKSQLEELKTQLELTKKDYNEKKKEKTKKILEKLTIRRDGILEVLAEHIAEERLQGIKSLPIEDMINSQSQDMLPNEGAKDNTTPT